MKLNTEALVVSWFGTSADQSAIFRPITDPTPDPGCFVCPVYSEDCY